MYCGEMATLPTVIGSIGNGLSRNWGNGVQIHAATALTITKIAIVAITTAMSPERERGRITVA